MGVVVAIYLRPKLYYISLFPSSSNVEEYEMESLLGQFYARIEGSQENIASEGISYILGKSKAAQDAIRSMISHDTNIDLPELSFRTQSVGANLERPDISGFDESQLERVIIEAKFWSSLTENQPNAYLKRLQGEGATLVFICPELRKHSLWGEVSRLLDQATVVRSDEGKIELEGKQFLLVKTWRNLIEEIRNALEKDHAKSLLSDLHQIDGLCEVIDSDAFLPITSEALSPEIARRVYSYYHLIDNVIEVLKKDGDVTIGNLKATGQSWGYTRYASAGGKWGIGLEVNLDFWGKYADTPIWLSFNGAVVSGNWTKNEVMANAVKGVGRPFFVKGDKSPSFPLYPLVDAVEDEVVNRMVMDIRDILQKMG